MIWHSISMTVLDVLRKATSAIAGNSRNYRALRESEKLYHHLFEVATEGITLRRLSDRKLVTINPAALKMLGYKEEEYVALPWGAVTHEDSRQANRDVSEALDMGVAAHNSLQILRKDGGTRDIETDVVPVSYQGKPHALSVSRDVTAEKQAERGRLEAFELLQQSEERFRTLFDSAPDGLYLLNDKAEFLDGNRVAEKLIGYSREELIGKSFLELDLLSAEDLQRAAESLQESIKGLPTGPDEFTLRRKDGTQVPVEIRTYPTEIDGQRVVLGSARDITERKRMEEKLRASEVGLRSAQQLAHIGSADSDLVAQTQVISDELFRIYGMDADEYWREPGVEKFLDRIHEEDRPWVQRVFEAARLEGQDYEIQYRLVHSDGDLRWVQSTGSVSVDTDGKPIRIVAILQDITDGRVMETQLLQSQKMEAVGRLAGGIAHDFNNLLTVVTGYSELALDRLDERCPLSEDLEQIRRAGLRAAALTRQLLAFSRQQILEPRVLDLNTLVAEFEKLLRRTIGENIEFVTALDPNLGRVKVDPGQIEQVLLNLAVNARDAMLDGGKLTIETANVELDEAYATEHAPMTPGSYVTLAVTDTGMGMTKETQSQIFEPFFTTKAQGEGTGLGLATVYGIVKQSDGYIWAYSEPEMGTTFKIYLPRVNAAVRKERQKEITAHPQGGSETILVVEDEEMVRLLVVAILKEKGYQVLAAEHPEQALQVCQDHQDPIDLLVTDQVMPGSSGLELAEQIGQVVPGVKTLLISGYFDKATLRSGQLGPQMEFLGKPFSASALARKVREILDRRST